MNTFGFCLCLSLCALSAAQPGYRYVAPAVYSQSSGPVYTASASASSPSLSHLSVHGAASSSSPVLLQSPPTFAASAPVSSAAQFGSLQGSALGQGHSASAGQLSYQGSTPAGSTGQGSFQAFAPAAGLAGQGSFQAFAPASQSQLSFNQLGGFNSAQGQGSLQALAAGSSAQGQGSLQATSGQQQTIVTKDIYIHSAPEEPEETISTGQSAGGPARKNYRIVFIKTPSPKFTVSSAALSGALNEEKTVIYVLAKRPELNVVQQQVPQNAQKASKPEVFFIKYKTPAEAQLAQQEIQAQYDALGGSTSVSDEGIAPVHSVIGKAGGAGSAGASSGSGSGSSAGVGSGLGAASAAGFSSGSGSLSSGFGVGSGVASGIGSGFGSISGLSSGPSYSTGVSSVGGGFGDQSFLQAASSNSASALVSPTYLPVKNKKK